MIDNIEISDGAYFFKIKNQKKLSKTKIETIFKEISKDKMNGRYTLNEVRKEVALNGTTAQRSICIFKKQTKPSFFKESIANEYEIKFCYILILEYKDYIALSKKNIPINSTLDDYLDNIDYRVLSGLYADSNSKFHKLSLDNLDVSDLAIRKKAIEAQALENSLSTYSANNYAIRSMSISSGNNLYSMSLSTSKINKHNGKVNVEQLCGWMANVCNDIKSYSDKDSFLDNFATPISFSEEISKYTPNGLLFKLSSINDTSSKELSKCVYRNKRGAEVELNLERYITKYDYVLNLENQNKPESYIVKSDRTFLRFLNIEVKILKRSIKIKSKVLSSVTLHFRDGDKILLEDFINKFNCFVVTFTNPEIAYKSRSLLKNSQLLSRIESFMSVFEPCNDLDLVTSEKGIFTTNSTEFSPCSIFNKVENVIAKNATYLFLDDLGNEWADHISVSEGVIEFYHSKYGTEGLSASKFQDIVGQAQKNLGNMVPMEKLIEEKKTKWLRDYNTSDSTDTKISRLRRASYGQQNSLDQAIQFYKKQIQNPNLRKITYLVVTFISKSKLFDSLRELENGTLTNKRNEVTQILWFISSLISSCTEQGIEIKIICRE